LTTHAGSRREATATHVVVLLLAGMLMLATQYGCDSERTGDAVAQQGPALGVGEPSEAPIVQPQPAVPVAAKVSPAPTAPADNQPTVDAQGSPTPPPRTAIQDAGELDVLNPPGERVLLEGKYEALVVSDGRQAPPSRLPQSPGYEPPDDPEGSAVARGYRLAAPNEAQLTAGPASAEELARDLLWVIGANDRQGLFDLRISFEEFQGILWPEMPQSRPVTNISAEDAWFFLQRESVSAIDGALAERGGQSLAFERLTFDVGLTRFPNYRLYRGVVIHARQSDGQEVALKFAHTIVEKDGIWKVYMYKG